MTTRFRSILASLILGAASFAHASPTPPSDCKPTSRKPPTLEARVLGRSVLRVAGAKVIVAALKGRWSATAYTDEAGEARFTPPKAGTYSIRVTCDVSSCGDMRELEDTVELHSGSSTSTLLATESMVIY